MRFRPAYAVFFSSTLAIVAVFLLAAVVFSSKISPNKISPKSVASAKSVASTAGISKEGNTSQVSGDVLGTNVYTITASSDDAKYGGSGLFSNNQTDDPVGKPFGCNGDFRVSGLRYNNVNIEQYAVIDSATITFQPRTETGTNNQADDSVINTTNTGVNAIFEGDAEDNAATFNTDFRARPRTTANVPWSISSSWTVGNSYASPDIKNIIHEITSRNAWTPGNSLAVFWEDNGSTGDPNCNVPQHGSGRVAKSFDGGGSAVAPQLTVTWHTLTPASLGVNLNLPCSDTNYGGSNVTFTWASSGANSYEVDVSQFSTFTTGGNDSYAKKTISTIATNGGATWAEAGTPGSVASGIIGVGSVLSLSPNTPYYFRVYGLDSGGNKSAPAVYTNANSAPPNSFGVQTCPDQWVAPTPPDMPSDPVDTSDNTQCIVVSSANNGGGLINSTSHFFVTKSPPNFTYNWSAPLLPGFVLSTYHLYVSTDIIPSYASPNNIVSSLPANYAWRNTISPILTASATNWNPVGSVNYLGSSTTMIYYPGKTYYWAVQAIGTNGFAVWSVVQNFKVPPACSADLQVDVQKQSPIGAVPLNGSVNVNVRVYNNGNIPAPVTPVSGGSFAGYKIPVVAYRTWNNNGNTDDQATTTQTYNQCQLYAPTAFYPSWDNGSVYTGSNPTLLNYTYPSTRYYPNWDAVRGGATYKVAPITPYVDGYTVIEDVSKADMVTAINVTDGGSGYTTAPAVTITGDGTGAAASAVLNSSGAVSSIVVTNPGSGYTSATATIAPPPSVRTATATAMIAFSAVAAINVTDGGSGYTTAPAVTITGDGTGAAASAVVNSGAVSSIVVMPHGSGYTSATATIAPPPSVRTATATAMIPTVTNVNGGIFGGVGTNGVVGLKKGTMIEYNLNIPVASVGGTNQMHFILDPACTNPYENVAPIAHGGTSPWVSRMNPMTTINCPSAFNLFSPFQADIANGNDPTVNFPPPYITDPASPAFDPSKLPNSWCSNFGHQDISYTVSLPGFFTTQQGDVGTPSAFSYSMPTPPTISDYAITSGSTTPASNPSLSRSGWVQNQYPTTAAILPGGACGGSGGYCPSTAYNFMNARLKPAVLAANHNACDTTGLVAGFAQPLYNCSGSFTVGNSPATNPAANYNPPGGSTVVFVAGDLNIYSNIILSSASDTVVFVVAGNINIDHAVNNIDGVYIAGGAISDLPNGTTLAFDAGNNPILLTVHGALNASQINFQRYPTYYCVNPPSCTGSPSTQPGETIIYDPKYMAALTSLIGTSSTSWQEVAP